LDFDTSEESQWELFCPVDQAAITVGPSTVQWGQPQGGESAYGRRVFITELGYFGLAPIASMVQDQVCVLMGSKVPRIIRGDGDIYRFVGECYVYGIMDGEVLQGLDVDDVGFLKFSKVCR